MNRAIRDHFAAIYAFAVVVALSAPGTSGAASEEGRKPVDLGSGTHAGSIPSSGLRQSFVLGDAGRLISLELRLTSPGNLKAFLVRPTPSEVEPGPQPICEGIVSRTSATCEFVVPEGTVEVWVEAQRPFLNASYEIAVVELMTEVPSIEIPEAIPDIPGEIFWEGQLGVRSAEVLELELEEVTGEGLEVDLVELWLAFDAPRFIDLDFYAFDVDPRSSQDIRPICASEGITGIESCELGPRTEKIWVQVIAIDGVEGAVTNAKVSLRYVGGRLLPFYEAQQIRPGERRQVVGRESQEFRFTLDAGQVATISLAGHERSLRVEDEEGISYTQRRTMDGIPFVSIGKRVGNSGVVLGGLERSKSFLIRLGEAKGPPSLDANLSILRIRIPRLYSYLPILIPFRERDRERRALIVGQLGLRSIVQRFATTVTDFFTDPMGAFQPPLSKTWRRATIGHDGVVIFRLRFEGDIPITVDLTKEPKDLDVDLALLSRFGEVLNAGDQRVRLEPLLGEGSTSLRGERGFLAVVANPHKAGRGVGSFRIRLSRARADEL